MHNTYRPYNVNRPLNGNQLIKQFYYEGIVYLKKINSLVLTHSNKLENVYFV